MEALKRVVGKNAEDAASTFLSRNGLRLLQKNFSCKLGEIDLIMQDDADKEYPEIVFVEVRFRQYKDFNKAIESIDTFKQKRIIQTAMYYLQKTDLLDEMNCRFDVIGMSQIASGNNQSQYHFEWIKDAFTLDD